MDDGQLLWAVFYGCQEPLDDERYICFLLKTLTYIAGMKPIGKPICKIISDPMYPKFDGLSGIQILAESHLAIHTWPKQGAIRICLDSCKIFHVYDLLTFMGDTLKATKGYYHMIGGSDGMRPGTKIWENPKNQRTPIDKPKPPSNIVWKDIL